MDLELKDRRALVTGGSRGIGKRIAWRLAKEGADVAITARGQEALEATAGEIAADTGRRIFSIKADMRDDSSVAAMTAEAARVLGGLDILVNNAATPGGRKVAAIQDMDVADLLEDIDVKVGGYLRAARCAAPYMIKGGWGRIINIGGLAARLTGNYNSGIRSAAISALTKNLADELGPKGIVAIAIHPGAMRKMGAPSEQEAKSAAKTSNAALFESEVIASLVAMLSSSHALALNGETLSAGGGIRGIIDY